ncbi:MAG: hypothetical protein CME60_10965 [Halobacteriovoraceae bacterium]|nr:hypothetical protein [Halobacteriovoraceae bacterium]
MVPLSIVAIIESHKVEILEVYRKNRKLIVKTLVFLFLGYLLFGFVEYLHRKDLGITSLNYRQYEPLMVSNIGPCAKVKLSSSDQDIYKKCLESRMNFYKILARKDGSYSAIQTLILPVGDSTLFAIILFYFFIFYLISLEEDDDWLPALVPLVLGGAVFLTQNRVHSFFVFFIAVSLFVRGAFCKRKRISDLIISLPLVVLYLKGSEYLFFSIFNASTPSNIGHQIDFDTIFNSRVHDASESRIGLLNIFMSYIKSFSIKYPYLWYSLSFLPMALILKMRRKLLFFNYSLFLSFYWYFVVKYKLIPFGRNPGVSMESEFLKMLVKYDVFGLVVQACILSLILEKIILLLMLSAKDFSFFKVKLKGLLYAFMGGAFLLQQLISPYMVTGFVTFFFFISIFLIGSIDLLDSVNVKKTS